jgi:ATP-dependent helicase HrpA
MSPRSPRDLPIYAHAQEIVDAVRQHQVVVVEGPAGTGKTTQLPRLLKEAGLVPRLIGITQPRRIAAVSVAWRIAEEEGVAVGSEVGYAIRFDDATSPATRIKVMTDGILLQEARSDGDLSAYDILMVDEAHERSLNIDFTLGLLHRVLSRRRDLRVVISSATLHPGYFQRFFKDVAGTVPAVSVTSRTYPTEIHYRPSRRGGAPQAIVEEVVDHVTTLHRGPDGHVLVFLPGEGLITRVDEALRSLRLRDMKVLPLFGRLTREEQERVFEDFPGQRKVILSTNIAETSITIDDVGAVVDSGLAKLPWYNPGTGVTTLREEPISQASATQRAGRAGRTRPGTVIRMYDEESLGRRPRYTPEEILRVDLSEAVLRLIDLGVRDVERFPFPTPPPRQKLSAALDALLAMGAIDTDRNLTAVGRQMVPFPLSPPLARMVVEAANRFPAAVSDVLLVGAYLSVRSPFTYPAGEEEEARAAQARFRHPLGDAMTALQAYKRWLGAKDKALFSQQSYLDNDTLAFIQKAHRQLIDIAEELGVPVAEAHADPRDVTRCVATGFASNVLMRQGHTYVTSSELRVAIHPSSSLYGYQGRFIVAAELMNSGRVYAFNVSALEPEWLAEVNPMVARRWRVGPAQGGRRGAEPRPSAPPVPKFLTLGSQRLPVSQKGRRPTVDIPMAAVTELAQLGPRSLPEGTGRWRARVISAYGVMLRGGLREIMVMLPYLPWPREGATSPHVPIGVLCEPDRNLHTLERHLPALLDPMLGTHVPQPGWLTLVSNGGGGFWYDVIPDFPDALGTTVDALDDLAEAGPEVAPIAEAVARQTERLLRLADALEAAFASNGRAG